MVIPAAAELPLLTASVRIKQIRDTFDHLRDVRKGGNNQVYTVADAAISGFAVFFTQSPSFLDYQVQMQKERGRNNATLLFGLHEIPCDQQIRNLLDAVIPEDLAPLLMNIVAGLYRLLRWRRCLERFGEALTPEILLAQAVGRGSSP